MLTGKNQVENLENLVKELARKNQLANVEKLVKELAREITGLLPNGMPSINAEERRLVHIAGQLNPSMSTSELLESASNSTDPLTLLAAKGIKLVNELVRYNCQVLELLETGNCNTVQITGIPAKKFTSQ